MSELYLARAKLIMLEIHPTLEHVLANHLYVICVLDDAQLNAA